MNTGDSPRPWPLRRQIILPFFLLVLLVAVVGSGAMIYVATATGLSSLDDSLVRATVQSDDRLAALEADRLNDLRATLATPGLSGALESGDRAALAMLFDPMVAAARNARVRVRVLDAQGNTLVAIPDHDRTIAYARLAAVDRLLRGITDTRGDKNVVLTQDAGGAAVYWMGPVYDTVQHVTGAVLLGESVRDLGVQLRPGQGGALLFFDSSGRPLVAIPGMPSITQATRSSIEAGHLERISISADRHLYSVALTRWSMRASPVGFVGVALPADGVANHVLILRRLLVLGFTGLALLVLLVGFLLARRITRPLERLVSAIQTVAGGDLSHRAPPGRADEIGYLTASFNAMAASLEEKSAALEATWFASIEALARAIDARDPHTYGHSARVARLSLEVADAMHLDAAQLLMLRRASLLHDIGKIGIEDRVLRKPGPLEGWELRQMRQHPLIGYQMLKGLDFLETSLPGVRHHHEHWDGSGYPDRLTGDAIPLGVRILTVADALDAMTSDRPYRLALTFRAALRAIQAGAGTQFDPAVVDALTERDLAIESILDELGKVHGTPMDAIAERAV